MVRLLLHGGGIRQAGVKIKPAKSALQKQLPTVASRATVHLQQDSFAWCVLEVGVEGNDAVLYIYFELLVCHPSLFIHSDRATPAPFLCTTKSTSCIQNVGQKLVVNLLPLLGRCACW